MNKHRALSLILLTILVAGMGSQGISSEFEEYRKDQKKSMAEFTQGQEQAFGNFYKEQLKAFFADLDKYRDELSTLLTEKFQLVPAMWQAPDAA